MDESNEQPQQQQQQQQQQQHASTYTPGEDPTRLASAAQYFGIRNTRVPLRPIREQTPISESVSIAMSNSNSNLSNNGNADGSANADTSDVIKPTKKDSLSILKFGSTVLNEVGLIFSDSTLEAARMHSVGVTAMEERVAGDGTLHLRSIVRRMKTKKKKAAVPLGDLFQPPSEDERGRLEQKEAMEAGEEAVEEEYEEVIVETVYGGSISAAIFGIVKGMVGPAVLYLPRGFALSGYGVAIPAMIFATATYLYSATRLLQCWKVESTKLMEGMEKIQFLLDPEANPVLGKGKSSSAVNNTNYGSLVDGYDDEDTEYESKLENKYEHNSQRSTPPQVQGKLLTYPELARVAFGDISVLISGGIAAMQFGVCLTYLIFVPQNLYELIHNIFGVFVPTQLILLGMLAIEIPLCWIRDIRKLTPINILATLFIAFGLVSVLYIALFDSNQGIPTDNMNAVGGGDGVDGTVHEMSLIEEISHLPMIKDTWALFIGTSFFCFEGSITLLVPLQEAVYNQQDRAKFPSVNQKAISSIVAFYMVFGIICWASFGDSVQTALTTSLPEGTLSTLVQLAYSIAVIFTFPLQAFPALEVVCNTTQTKTGKNKPSQNAIIFKRNLIATAIICFLGVIAIMASNYLGNVVSLLGSLVGIPIALIYPPLMHNRIVPDSPKSTRWMNICLSLVGVFAAGAASYTTLASWDEGAEG